MAYKRQTNYRLEVTAILLTVDVALFALDWRWWVAYTTAFVWGWWRWACWAGARTPRRIEPAWVEQLDRWCGHLDLDTPQILGHEYTEAGERYWLRVTGTYENDHGARKVMTPEIFKGFWQRFRAVAGDGCRGVFISDPDPKHGGRCSMEVRWREVARPRYRACVEMSPTHTRETYSPEETAAAIAEAVANGYTPPPPTLGAPRPAELAGEG
jgi:hypothetical protein